MASKKRNEGRCMLCLEEKPLCNAHVISDFLFREMYTEEGHELYKVTFEGGVPRLDRKPVYCAEYDQNILCKHCDTKILGNKYENYAARALLEPSAKERTLKRRKSPMGIEWFETGGFDYNRLKLFFLAQFWRASISKRPFFGKLNLHPRHEERIRRMLFTGQPGSDKEYPVTLTYMNQYGGPPLDMHPEPWSARPEHTRGHWEYTIILDHFIYQLYLSPSHMPRGLRPLRLRSNGRLSVKLATREEVAAVLRLLAGLS